MELKWESIYSFRILNSENISRNKTYGSFWERGKAVVRRTFIEIMPTFRKISSKQPNFTPKNVRKRRMN